MNLLRPALLLTVFFMLFSSSRAALQVGDAAPTITATTDASTPLALGDVYSKGYTLVYFYPKADTPGCTKQGCSLRDSYEILTKKGVTVIGVSADDVAAQKAFKEKYNLPFTLLADKDGAVIKAFGVPPAMPLTSMAARQAYLIDRNGKIIWADYKASTDKQADDVLAQLAKLGV
jgi:peroxiredoxin Q/BCP